MDNNSFFEMEYGSDFAYILKDNEIFLSTEYKIFKNMESKNFLRCMKAAYNGKVQLYYLTDSYKKIEDVINHIASEKLVTVLANLLENIIEIKNNGFLACNSVNASLEKIYIDIDCYKVKFVYLPVRKRFYKNEAAFEEELRNNLINLLKHSEIMRSPEIDILTLQLENKALSLEDIYNNAKDNIKKVRESIDKTEKDFEKKVRLVSIEPSQNTIIDITKDDFTIGKKASEVDGVIQTNKMISRIHCKVVKIKDQYGIIDLLSANGTFVNGVRVKSNQVYLIKNGDIIQLANSSFRFFIE